MKKIKKYELTAADRSDGGHAHAKLVRRRKDKQVAGIAQNFARLTGLEDVKFRPALMSLARVSLLAERCYQVLKDRESLLNAKGELCESIDSFRRLALAQAQMLDMLGLTPRAAQEMRSWAEHELDLVGILAKRVTANGETKPATDEQ
jgi:hypothetical protein